MTCIVLFEVNSYGEITDLLFNTSAEPQSCDLNQTDLKEKSWKFFLRLEDDEFS